MYHISFKSSSNRAYFPVCLGLPPISSLAKLGRPFGIRVVNLNHDMYLSRKGFTSLKTPDIM